MTLSAPRIPECRSRENPAPRTGPSPTTTAVGSERGRPCPGCCRVLAVRSTKPRMFPADRPNRSVRRVSRCRCLAMGNVSRGWDNCYPLLRERRCCLSEPVMLLMRILASTPVRPAWSCFGTGRRARYNGSRFPGSGPGMFGRRQPVPVAGVKQSGGFACRGRIEAFVSIPPCCPCALPARAANRQHSRGPARDPQSSGGSHATTRQGPGC